MARNMQGKNHASPVGEVGEVGVVGVVGVVGEADGARLGGHRQNGTDATPPGGERPD